MGVFGHWSRLLGMPSPSQSLFSGLSFTSQPSSLPYQGTVLSPPMPLKVSPTTMKPPSEVCLTALASEPYGPPPPMDLSHNLEPLASMRTSQKSLPATLGLVLLPLGGDWEYPARMYPASGMRSAANKVSKSLPPKVRSQTVFPRLSTSRTHASLWPKPRLVLLPLAGAPAVPVSKALPLGKISTTSSQSWLVVP